MTGEFLLSFRVLRRTRGCWRTSNDALTRAVLGKASLEVAGIEPASSGVSIGLLRAQPALDCRGRHHCRRLCRPVANEDVLSSQLVLPLSKPYLMAPTFRSIGLRPGGRRYLSSERELRLGVCFWFRLFNVVPETTARFSYLDDRSRNQSPPCLGLH